MTGRVILILAVVTVLAGWPLSLVKNPPRFVPASIFPQADTEMEKRQLTDKLGLVTSPIKRLYYNKITTIPVTRYTTNLLYLTNPNDYFFANHPQVDANDKDTRMKFPYPAIFPFVLGIYAAIKNNRHRNLWLYTGAAVLTLAFFRQPDGWNFALYPAIGWFTVDGISEINRSESGPVWLSLITLLSLTEIARIFI